MKSSVLCTEAEVGDQSFKVFKVRVKPWFMHSALSLRSPHTCPACFLVGASAAKPHMDDTSAIFHILLGRAQRSPTWTIHLGFSDVRRTALILRGGALRVDLLRMLIVV